MVLQAPTKENLCNHRAPANLTRHTNWRQRRWDTFKLGFVQIVTAARHNDLNGLLAHHDQISVKRYSMNPRISDDKNNASVEITNGLGFLVRKSKYIQLILVDHSSKVGKQKCHLCWNCYDCCVLTCSNKMLVEHIYLTHNWSCHP